jgi:hypothetical protein
MKSEQRLGDWKFICDRSGFEGWASESALTWDGRRVLKRFLGDEGRRHPQDLVRGKPDDQRVPWARPEAADVFLSPGDVTQDDL